uniref:Beta-Casp domain-containing protein n=1 Tax=Syphacia muris TaxID=451379 RepID=A0A0N5ADZ1_9BILA
MRIARTSFSWQTHRPCILLQWPSATILLDCAADFSTLSSFMPVKLYAGPRLNKFPNYRSNVPNLRRHGDEVFVDSSVEVHPVSLDKSILETVDVILISNCMSLFTLPFISECEGFRGLIYTTAPVLELGRLMGHEFLDFIEADDRTPANDDWKLQKIYNNFTNKPTSNPQDWRPFYTLEQFESALKKVDIVSYRDLINLHSVVEITAYSSGYSIGSCNWVIRTETEKCFSYTVTLSVFVGIELNIIQMKVYNVCAVAVDALKKNGSVLMPVSPTGTIYDLLEVIAHQMDQHNVSQDVPIYFISPVAKETLAFSSIAMEWLSEKKQEYFYLPDQAFAHGKMLKSGRLKVYDTSHGTFSRQMRTPCVIFCGHPSLRLGDAVNFLEMWGSDARNAIIMTDPDYPLGDVYGPYRNLAIRAFFYPIDTRLDYTQLNSAIVSDLAPKLLVLPEEPRLMFHCGDTVNIPSIVKRKRIIITPEHFPDLTFRSQKTSNGLGMAVLDGYLSAYDNNFVLSPCTGPNRIRPRLVGSIDADILVKMLREPKLSAEIKILDEGYRTQVLCDSEDGRHRIFKVLSSCLKKICS